MKYVMIKCNMGKGEARMMPCLFPSSLVHSVVAEAFTAALRKHGYTEVKVTSAGEVSLFGAGLDCTGFSETLGVRSSTEAARIIEGHDYCQERKDDSESSTGNVGDRRR